MSVQLLILVVTAVLAVVAVVAAVIAVIAVRRLRALHHAAPPEPAELHVPPVEHGVSLAEREIQREPERDVVRVVEGRVIVQPTQDQLVAATMTRPSVRLSIFAAGLAHALRPESRDRITALMRREYRARKRARQRAAKAAARATNDPPPASGRGWVGS